MLREKSRQEVEDENRARAASNALNRLGVAVKYVTSPYAKPVFDLISDAKRDAVRCEKYRDQRAARARGINDILFVVPDQTGVIPVLTEIVGMVETICLTRSASQIAAFDNITALVDSTKPFMPKQDAF